MASAHLVPALKLFSQGSLSLDGISPIRAVLGLLVDGPWSGAYPGLAFGLLAALGSLVLGGSFLLQWLFQGVLPEGGLQLLAAQALITALLAPLVCSVLLLRWRQLLSARG